MSAIDKKAMRHEMYRKKIPRSYIVLFFFIVLFFISFSYVFVGFYFNHWYTGPARIAARVLPLPAVVVDNEIVWYTDISEMANVFAVASESFVTEIDDPFQFAINRNVSNTHLNHLADQLGISVSRTEVREYEISDTDLDVFLKKVGWTESQYRRYIVEPLLIAQVTEEAVYSSSELQSSAKERIENIERDIQLGIKFSDLAVQYSDDLSSDNGGFIGLFTDEDLPIGLESVFNMEVDAVSGVLETPTDFAIVYINDATEIDDERVRVGLQIITIHKDSLADVLDEFVKDVPVYYFVR